MNFYKPKRHIDRVFIHCSAASRPDITVEDIDSWHKQRGFSEVGYHYFIRTNGTLERGRSLEKTPAAQRGHNSNTIAICLNGLHYHDFTDEQFDTLIDLCQEINAAIPGVTFHGHREVSSKACPVFNYREVLNLSSTGVMLGIQAQVKANKAKAIILISKQVVMAYQQTKGLTADGIVGPRTWQELTNG